MRSSRKVHRYIKVQFCMRTFLFCHKYLFSNRLNSVPPPAISPRMNFGGKHRINECRGKFRSSYGGRPLWLGLEEAQWGWGKTNIALTEKKEARKGSRAIIMKWSSLSNQSTLGECQFLFILHQSRPMAPKADSKINIWGETWGVFGALGPLPASLEVTNPKRSVPKVWRVPVENRFIYRDAQRGGRWCRGYSGRIWE